MLGRISSQNVQRGTLPVHFTTSIRCKGRKMYFVVIVTMWGDSRTFRTVTENECNQVFNSWRATPEWAYLAKGNSYVGIVYSERNLAPVEGGNS
jgi:hypothetical protein